ncbi:MAG: hypothetical protein AABY22_27500 [Nanoarchaeota archaeon]
MASISGDFNWKAMGHSNVTPSANVLYDQSTTGFVFQKTDYSSTAPNNFTISGGNGTVLNANTSRILFFVQNLAANPLYLKYGANASNTSFNLVLKSGNGSNDGGGGSINDSTWKGIISTSGVSPNYIAWELV